MYIQHTHKYVCTVDLSTTIAVVAESAVRGSGRSPHIARHAPLELDLLPHVIHCLITSRGTQCSTTGSRLCRQVIQTQLGKGKLSTGECIAFVASGPTDG